MSANRSNPVDLDKPYEPNEIGLRGIMGFTIGLVLLIVITFALMWAFLNVLKDYAVDNAGPANPMAMSDKERVPPEPRLQAAPGFGVESEDGRVNLELREPQAEYRELQKQWRVLWDKGRKHQTTGVFTVRPINEAKEMLLQQNIKARSGAEAEETLRNSLSYPSEASSGRMASETRR